MVCIDRPTRIYIYIYIYIYIVLYDILLVGMQVYVVLLLVNNGAPPCTGLIS